MESLHGVFNKRSLVFGLLCIGSIACASLFAACNASRFIKTDIEKQDGLPGMLAYCWRVQKDNAASGGGNARNCDTLQDEYLRQEKRKICLEDLKDAKRCVCLTYRFCQTVID
jgi:hypothetical protein